MRAGEITPTARNARHGGSTLWGLAAAFTCSLLVLAWVCPTSAAAAAAVVEVTVEAAWPLGLNTTLGEARAKALAEAWRLAADQGAGVEVQARTIYQDSHERSDYLRTASRGLIIRGTVLLDELGDRDGRHQWVVRHEKTDCSYKGLFYLACAIIASRKA